MPPRKRPSRTTTVSTFVAAVRDAIAYRPIFDLLSEASSRAIAWWGADDSPESADEILRLAANAIRVEAALSGRAPAVCSVSMPDDATDEEIEAWAMHLVRIERFSAKRLAAEFGYGPPPAPSPPKATSKRPPVPRRKPLSKSERLGFLKILQAHVLDLARVDVNAFAEYCLVDDDSGDYLTQSPTQEAWHALADLHPRLVLFSSISSGKSTQISVIRSIWQLGRNHDLRIVILSNASSQASKLVVQIGNLIEANERIHEVFPDLKPGATWNTLELTVQRTTGAKDPSVRAVGVAGALTSARVDVLIIDDLLDAENTATEALRAQTFEWVRKVALSRLQAGARVICVGTPWHQTDAMARLAALPGWFSQRFPIAREDGTLTWPEKRDAEWVERKRIDLGALEFSRQCKCESRDDSTARFKREWLEAAQEKGTGMALVDDLSDLFPDGQLPPGYTTWTGIDLAFGKNKSAKARGQSDDCAIVSFLQSPEGFRRILSITIGKFDGPQLVKLIRREHQRFDSRIAVENNAGQQLILDFMPNARDYLFSHTTTSQKNDPIHGVEGMAIELEQGTWCFPGRSKEMDRLVTACLNYSPAKHLDDVMAALYFARTLSKRLVGAPQAGVVTVRIVGAPDEDERRDRRRAAAGPSAAQIAYRKSLFGVGEATCEPEPEPEERATAARPAEVEEPGYLERLFTPPSRPANDVDERSAREIARDRGRSSSTERSTRASVDRLSGGVAPSSDEEAVEALGHWRRGGWTGGGVL